MLQYENKTHNGQCALFTSHGNVKRDLTISKTVDPSLSPSTVYSYWKRSSKAGMGNSKANPAAHNQYNNISASLPYGWLTHYWTTQSTLIKIEHTVWRPTELFPGSCNTLILSKCPPHWKRKPYQRINYFAQQLGKC